MELASFIKSTVYKILIILTISTMVFSTLGIQPASASYTDTLSPVEQMNVKRILMVNF